MACHSALHLYNPREANQTVSPFSVKADRKTCCIQRNQQKNISMVHFTSLLVTFELTEKLIILYESPFIAYPDGKWMIAQRWLTLTAHIWPTGCCGNLASESSRCNTKTNKLMIRSLMKPYPRDDMDRKLQLGHFQHNIEMPGTCGMIGPMLWKSQTCPLTVRFGTQWIFIDQP